MGATLARYLTEQARRSEPKQTKGIAPKIVEIIKSLMERKQWPLYATQPVPGAIQGIVTNRVNMAVNILARWDQKRCS